MGGKIIPRIRLTSAKDFVEVEAELGNFNFKLEKKISDRYFLDPHVSMKKIVILHLSKY